MTVMQSGLPTANKSILSPTTLVYIIALADTFGGLVQGVFPATLLLRTGMISFLLLHAFGLGETRLSARLLWFVVFGYFLARLLIDFLAVLDERVLGVEGGSTLRLLYFPLLYAYLLVALERGSITREQIRSCLLMYGWLILASLLLGEITGMGGVIEGRGADMDGGKGFMIGANEVGLMLLLTAPFVGADIMRRTHSVVVGGIAQLVIYGVSGLYVFTKSSLIAALSSAFSVYRAFARRGRAARVLLWIALCVAIVAIARLIYQNLEAIEAFALGTFFSALLNDGMVAFLFRGRQDYISAIYPQLLEHGANWLFLLFGAGEFFMREVSVAPLMLAPGEGTTFEMDFFDVLGAYGVIGFGLYALLVGVLLRRAGKRQMPIEISVAIFGVLGHSFLAGHVLFSPQVTTLLALILLYYRVSGGEMKTSGASAVPNDAPTCEQRN